MTDPTRSAGNRWDPRRWSLGARIGVALVVAALAPMAVLTRFSLDAGRQAVERAQLDSTEGSATVSAAAVREYLAGVGARADQLGTRSDVVDFVSGGDGPPPGLDGEIGAGDVETVALLDRSGEVLATAGRAPLADGAAGQKWFTDAVAGLASISPVQLDTESGLGTVTVAAPARNPGSAVNGVAAITVRGADVLYALNQAPLAPGGQSVLIDSSATVVLARDARLVGRSFDELGVGSLAAAIAAAPAGTDPDVTLRSRGPQVAGWDTVEDGFVAVVFEPREVFMGPINQLGTTTLILFIVVGLLAVVAAVLLARRLSRPVGVLTAAAGRLEAGEPVDDDALSTIGRSQDDVGRLARVFARMAEQVAVRERKLREEVKALRIEIDEERRRVAVAEVVDTDFFRDLEGRAAEMRRRARGESSPDTPPGTEADG